MERHSCTANVITQYTDALTSRPNGLGSSGKDKKMTGQVLCQNFKCLVIRQKRPVMTDDRTLFQPLPAKGGGHFLNYRMGSRR